MKQLKWAHLIAYALFTIPWLYLIFIYSSLPETIPTHFDSKGLPNDYGNKITLPVSIGVLTVVGLGVFYLLRNIKSLDPKRNAGVSSSVFNKMALAIVVFISFLSVMIISSTVHGSILFSRLILPLMGLFFAYMGNLMFSLKPNYFAGIRLPWTLENEENWRKTHQLGGKLWFGGGLLITLTSLLFNDKTAQIIFISIAVIITIIPAYYSFRLFKKQKKSSV